jgi:hypothetical protein
MYVYCIPTIWRWFYFGTIGRFVQMYQIYTQPIFHKLEDTVTFISTRGLAQWVRSLDITTHISLSPIRCGFVPSFVNYKKGCTRLAAASDKVYQLLAQGWWFSPGTLASSTTKTGHHDITETPKFKFKLYLLVIFIGEVAFRTYW